MGMRKTAIVALIALAGVNAPLNQGVSFAQPAPGAMAPAPEAAPQMVSTLSADDKAALVKKLKAAKKHDKIARAGWSQEPLTQAGYDKKIERDQCAARQDAKGRGFPAERRRKGGEVAGHCAVLILRDVKYVQHAVQDRRDQNADDRDEREAAIERVD